MPRRGVQSATITQHQSSTEGSMSENVPTADLIARLRAGDAQAAAEFVRHYDQRSACESASGSVSQDARLRRVFDSMDICQSVLASFFVRAPPASSISISQESRGSFGADGPPQIGPPDSEAAGQAARYPSDARHRPRTIGRCRSTQVPASGARDRNCWGKYKNACRRKSAAWLTAGRRGVTGPPSPPRWAALPMACACSCPGPSTASWRTAWT